eukprot:TRINITY_DN30359_c0_g1_i1.p1 TRINITY_DN30359_c0_g1~~TRINITY_DN30359_c0_g1_i1.p1  ORF type:complete len:785 (+),score=170.24 TRINITY_DN30359_c0_g1_i1:301-2655(+)
MAADRGYASRLPRLAAQANWDELAVPVDAAVGAEEEDSGGGEEPEEIAALIEARPLGLDIAPASADGLHGAVVRSCEGAAEAAGVEVGAAILSINEQPVADLPTDDIRGRLDEEPLPLLLGLRAPQAPAAPAGKKPRITVCTAGCRGSYRVVCEAVERLGWQVLPAETRDCSVVWLEHSDPTEGLAPVQTVSRIDAFLHYCRKARLAQSLNMWIDELPDDFAFAPKTWVLPHDAAAIEAVMARGKETFIAKPTAGSQGKGIVLAKKYRDLEHIVQKSRPMDGKVVLANEYVVQRYIAKPLLLDGLKFDLRLYVVVTSVVPMRAYLYKEGLARFCTVPYQPPKEDNLQEACMHLTNFAVNKRSKDFQTSDGAQHTEGSKRSVSAVFHQIQREHGVNAAQLWEKVAHLAANTLMALRPGLVEFYVHERPRPLHPLGPKGFQIIGLDVIIDGNLEPQLLELNANASLSAVQPGGGSTEAAGAAEANAAGSGDAAAALPPAGAAPGAPASTLEVRPAAAERPRSRTGSGISSGASASAPAGGGPPSRRSRMSHSRSRRASSKEAQTDNPPREKITVTSELDLEVKRELVHQALLVAHPAPQAKALRMRRRWLQELKAGPKGGRGLIPLDDDGEWVLPGRPTRAEAVRPDAPARCPALDALDCEVLAAEGVNAYARSHLAAYRCWVRSCGQSQDTLGQVQMLKLLERGGMIGAGASFPDRVAAQLWLSREWRDVALGAFGVTFPQFVALLSRLGRRLVGSGEAKEEEGEEPSHIESIEAIMATGLCDPD